VAGWLAGEAALVCARLTSNPDATPHVDPLATDVWGLGTPRKGWCREDKPWT